MKRKSIKQTFLIKRQTLIRICLFAFCFALISTPFMAPSQSVYAACVDGIDDTTGEPCLDIDADDLASNLFKWASIFITVFLPIAAIGIGITLAANIIGSLKGLVGGFRL